MKHIKKFKNEKLNENKDRKFDPFKAITYNIELKILFEGFDYSTLNFKLLFGHNDIQNEEELKTRIDDRLKVFDNIVSYDIIKIDKATGTDRILPMY